MKIAICYFGNTGGKIASFGSGGYLNPSNVLIKNHKIFSSETTEIDYFIHSWSINYGNEIKAIINPKSYLFEKYNEKLIKPFEEFGLKHFNTYLNNSFNDETKEKMINLLSASQYRWYSNCYSIRLMNNYAEKHQIKYDWIIQTRLDLIFFSKFLFKDLDNDTVYLPKRHNDIDNSLEDVFVASSHQNALKFSELFNERTKFSILPPYALKNFLDEKKMNYKQFKTLNKDYNLSRNINLEFGTKLKIKILNIIDNIIKILNYIKKKIRN